MDRKLADLSSFCQSILDNHPHINYGGCCVFAAMIAKHLEKHTETRIVVGDWAALDDDTGDNIRNIDDARPSVRKNTMVEWNNGGVQFGHVLVEITYKRKKYHVDARGVFPAAERDPSFRYPIYNGSLTLKEAAKLGASSKGWNTTFDREEIPMIKRAVNKYFKEFQL